MIKKPGYLLLALLVSGCAGGKYSNQNLASRHQKNLITTYEIAALPNAGTSTAYEVIRRLRPHFLYSHGCQATNSQIFEEPLVLLDGIRMSGRNRLAEIPASNIEEIRYLSSMEAKVLHGGINNCGVLAIVTKSGE